jgi:hypothetical protein
VDGILALVASWGTSGGTLHLWANGAPSATGEGSRQILTGRGWTVTTSS